jgi:galactose mutarotase-like enzyme
MSNAQNIAIRSTDLSAEINPLGAQLSVLRDADGRDLLWHGDASIWAGRAPILFPIVGTLAGGKYRYGSQQYALSRHGFARNKPFDQLATTPSTALFRLRADDATRAVYPFEFELDVLFEIEGAALSLVATVRNTGTEAMPASIGFHPGFRWPLPYDQPRAEHFIEFPSDEPAPVRRINSDGLLTSERHPTPVVQRRLQLKDELFTNDVLIFDQLQSQSVLYGAASGPRIEVRFPGAQYLGVWTRPGAPFICIEPWQGVTDPAGFSGDIREKPGIFRVPPGSSHRFGMTIVLQTSR